MNALREGLLLHRVRSTFRQFVRELLDAIESIGEVNRGRRRHHAIVGYRTIIVTSNNSRGSGWPEPRAPQITFAFALTRLRLRR